MRYRSDEWDVYREDGSHVQVKGPREFRHTLSTVVNGLVARGFVILGFWEETCDKDELTPGTWDHFVTVAAPSLAVWAALRPEALCQ